MRAPIPKIKGLLKWPYVRNGKIKADVEFESGLVAVMGVEMVSLEGHITRNDGTREPTKLLSLTHRNPITEQRLREQYSAGEVELEGSK